MKEKLVKLEKMLAESNEKSSNLLELFLSFGQIVIGPEPEKIAMEQGNFASMDNEINETAALNIVPLQVTHAWDIYQQQNPFQYENDLDQTPSSVIDEDYEWFADDENMKRYLAT